MIKPLYITLILTSTCSIAQQHLPQINAKKTIVEQFELIAESQPYSLHKQPITKLEATLYHDDTIELRGYAEYSVGEPLKGYRYSVDLNSKSYSIEALSKTELHIKSLSLIHI